MKRREEDEEQGPYLFCESCEQMFEKMQMQDCPYCGRKFCTSCAVRSGHLAFCGKACAKNWFFADDEEEAEASDRGRDEG